ncbi:acyl-CoA dehydrogenase family protein [Bacillus sp. FJAT-26390]|uniref:acyl-CoA dehydrogenase family protein n=1 Tax=Bacillus sp. FJAT-26390 TaxID=1743142 RepID=UPI000807CADA|nr:acyl-CoA dehydrogenase family protein [Bacillus sp. FJAT-26390]OBZ09437.1 monooxygenase [Bacillus sp. FJAT-26390]
MGVAIEPIYLTVAAELAERFREDAVQRDKEGGTPKIQRDWIRESGLLKLLIPEEYGGDGGRWSDVLKVVREFSRSDAALAHLYGYHFLCMVAPHLAGTEEQKRYFYELTARHHYFWGNSSNPLEKSIIGKHTTRGVVVNGSKSFSSGSPDSDLLAISWNDEETGEYYEGIIPTSREGVRIVDDWDNMGQRQTGSGTVVFANVWVKPNEILERPYSGQTVFSTIIPLLSQSILASIFIGSAAGALEEARAYTKTHAKPWYTSGVEQASAEPSTIARYGDLWTDYQSALSLVEKADRELDYIWSKDIDLTEKERGECAVLIAAANVKAGKTALDITNRIFEVMGARATSSKYGFDRFWRNVRTHTLHNPTEFKLRSVGNWYLNGVSPLPGFYS